MCKFAIKKCKKKYGKIINIASIIYFLGNLGSCYAASKAVIAFSKSLAMSMQKKIFALIVFLKH